MVENPKSTQTHLLEFIVTDVKGKQELYTDNQISDIRYQEIR